MRESIIHTTLAVHTTPQGSISICISSKRKLKFTLRRRFMQMISLYILSQSFLSHTTRNNYFYFSFILPLQILLSSDVKFYADDILLYLRPKAS